VGKCCARPPRLCDVCLARGPGAGGGWPTTTAVRPLPLGAWHRARRSNKVSNALLAICLERLGAFFRIADEERTRRVDNRYQIGQQCRLQRFPASRHPAIVALNFNDATKLGKARAREPNLKKTGESSASHSSKIRFTHYSHTSVVHSQCLEFDTQDTGPAYIRMRLTLARGPLDPLLSQPYSNSRRAGPLNA